jgi:hypothetical protein
MFIVLLNVHDCVDYSFSKYVSPSDFRLFTITTHRLLEYQFIFACVFRMWNMSVVVMQYVCPSNLNSLHSC